MTGGVPVDLPQAFHDASARSWLALPRTDRADEYPMHPDPWRNK
jgi:hypothetical protein